MSAPQRSQGPATPAWAPPQGFGPRVKAAWVTVVLMGICIVAFAATVGVCAGRVEQPAEMLTDSLLDLSVCRPTLEDAGALRLSNLWLDGAWWRVVSAGLLHGSVLHLVLNTWSLWVVGEWCEITWGHRRTVVLFLLASVSGCLASAAWVEAPMVVGASAGIMGMAGALFVGRLLGRGHVAVRLRPISARVLGVWLGVLVALGFFIDMIAQAGHLGGLAGGLFLGLAWSGREAVIAVSGRLGLALGISGLVLAARQSSGREGYYEYLGQGYLDRGMDQEAATAFGRALERRPEEPSLANDVAYSLAKAGRQLGYAEDLVRLALVQEPENPSYLDTLGWVLCRGGSEDAGRVELEKASELSEGEDEEIEGHLEDCGSVGVEG
ncbi:MAG: rhomboid family intramembrane serine protease [Myxococcota bacterium]